MSSIGVIYYKRRDYVQALQHYHKALEIDRKVGTKHSIMLCISNLGQLYEAMKLRRKANACYREAVHLAEEIGLQEAAKEFRSSIKQS